MRFRRLGLARYGRFTDFTLDFGATAPDQGDFHLVYGPNEAGKSTIFSAIVEYLFGMARETPYNFLHDYNALKIDGEVEHEGAATTLSRIKRTTGDLLDAMGDPAPEAALAGMLGGVDRDGYVSMFSLDEASLRDGGKFVIDAKGDFGQLLYGASAGVAALSERLAALEAEANAIHRAGAHKTALRKLNADLGALGKERDAVDVKASAHVDLARKFEATKAEEEEAREALKHARTESDAVKKRLGAQSALAELLEIETAMAAAPPLPETPPGWSGRIDQLLTSRSESVVARDEARQRLDVLKDDAATIEVDPDVLKVAEKIEGDVADNLRSRARAGAGDLPTRERELTASEEDIGRKLTRLDLAVGDLEAVTPAQLSEAERLAATWPRISTKLDEAKRELAEQQARLTDADAPDQAMLTKLEAAVSAAENSDVLGRISALRQSVAREESGVETLVADLSPWNGDLEDLAALSVSEDARSGALAEAVKQANDGLARIVERKSEADEEAARAEATERAAREALAAPDDATFADMLARRDALWRAHADALDPETAEAFRTALEETDRAAEQRLADAAGVAMLRRAAGDLAAAAAKARQVEATHREAEKAAEAARTAASAAAVAAGLPEDMAPADLAAWARRREEALQAWRELEADRSALADAQNEAIKLAAALAEALPEGGAGADLQGLTPTARRRLTELTETATAAKALEGRKRGLKTAAAESERWRTAWNAATDGTWLSETPPDAAAETIAAYRELFHAHEAARQLKRRIESMKADVAAFGDHVAATATTLGLSEEDAGDALVQDTRIRERLAAAKSAESAMRQNADAQNREKQALADAENRLSALDQEAAPLLAHFNVEALQEAAQCLKAVERRDAQMRQKAALEASIVAASEDRPLAEARESVAAATEADLQEADLALDAAEARWRDATAAFGAADAALQGVDKDGAAAALEQRRQTTMLEIEEAAKTYLRLKLGGMAAERALDAYRRRRRTGMLERASDTFRQITRGSFSGLATENAGDGKERLIALRKDGGARLVDKEMSMATQSQLYLALRVAGFYEFSGPRPPFVGDDIIETFDDDRALETFAVLGEMAREGQVIYLTHHAHLKDIARDACPGVRIHDLPDPLTGPAEAAP